MPESSRGAPHLKVGQAYLAGTAALFSLATLIGLTLHAAAQ
jgi:hypothetical protein